MSRKECLTNMKTGYIYKLTSPNGKCYIGQTFNIKKRISEYKTFHHCQNQRKIYNALKKYGFDNFILDILEEITFEEVNTIKEILNSLEIMYISKYNSIKEGYNICVGGNQHRLGVKETEEQRQKKKDIWTKEKREQQSLRIKGENNPRFGKKFGRSHRARYIDQFNLDGTFIQTHESLMSITKTVTTINGKIIDYRNVFKAVTGKAKTVGGYVWKYKNTEYE